MTKKRYTNPRATAIELHQQLLYAVSGENQGWGTKRNNLDLEYEEEEYENTKLRKSFMTNW